VGRIRTKHVKNIAKEILQKYFELFTDDFEKNKKILEKVAVFRSKKLRNVVAGYITSLIKKIKEAS